MQRRDLLSTAGIGAAVLTLGHRPAKADDHDHHGHDSSIMEECARKCNEAARHCLDQICEGAGDAEYHAKAVEMTIACQDFCLLSAQLTARKSALQATAHEANARACDECAELCEKSDEKIMRECAEKCRECAEHCREMARHAGHSG